MNHILLFATVFSLSATALAAPRPNIVVILADDLGYADLGAQGGTDIPTPHIDSIAKNGARLTDAYANGSFCTPTRAALMSCRYQHRYGVEDLSSTTGPLPLAAKTLPDRLKAAGYLTGMVGKWHLGDQPGFTPLDRGFVDFFGFLGGGHFYLPKPEAKGEYAAPILRNREATQETRYLTDAFGEEAAAYIERQRGAEKPFFLYLAFNAVHTPMQATETHESRFPGIKDPLRRTYAGMLGAMDDAVGRVLARLKEIGEYENTMVVFTSDNGGPTTRNAVNGSRNTPLRGSKCETFEGGIRVPLFVQWPGTIQPGTTFTKPAISFDISATALAQAGADATNVDGVDLIPFLTGKKAGNTHEELFWRNRTLSNNYAMRQGDWKYVFSTEGDAKPGPKQTPGRDRLFNLADDIGEKNDLAPRHPEKLAELKKRYQAWSDEVDAECRSLGLEPKFPKEEPLPDPNPQRYDLQKRASEIDPHAREHKDIDFLFTDEKGKPQDLQHAMVDTRVPTRGKLVIWLMDHNAGLAERVSGYGMHYIQVSYAKSWFSKLAREQLNDGRSIGKIRLEAATGEDHSPLVAIPEPDGMAGRALQFVKWLAKEHPQGKWEQFVTADGSALAWDKVTMSGISHGSTTAARFAIHQKVDRVVMFSGPRDNTESWQSLPSATSSNRFFGFTHVLDGGWVGDHYCRSWQLLKLHGHGPVVNVDTVPRPYGNTRRLITNSDVNNDGRRAHTTVVPGGSAGKDAKGDYIHEDVWRYLFTQPVDIAGEAVPMDADCKMDQR